MLFPSQHEDRSIDSWNYKCCKSCDEIMRMTIFFYKFGQAMILFFHSIKCKVSSIFLLFPYISNNQSLKKNEMKTKKGDSMILSE